MLKETYEKCIKPEGQYNGVKIKEKEVSEASYDHITYHHVVQLCRPREQTTSGLHLVWHVCSLSGLCWLCIQSQRYHCDLTGARA